MRTLMASLSVHVRQRFRFGESSMPWHIDFTGMPSESQQLLHLDTLDEDKLRIRESRCHLRDELGNEHRPLCGDGRCRCQYSLDFHLFSQVDDKRTDR